MQPKKSSLSAITRLQLSKEGALPTDYLFNRWIASKDLNISDPFIDRSN